MVNPFFNYPKPEELEQRCLEAPKTGALVVHGYSLKLRDHEYVIHCRVEKAIKILLKGRYEGIIFTGGNPFHDITEAETLSHRFFERLDELGAFEVYKSKLNIKHLKKIIEEKDSKTSWQNILNIKEIAEKEKYKQLTVISSKDFIPRGCFIYKKIFNNSPINIYFMGSNEKLPCMYLLLEKIKTNYQYIRHFIR